MISALRAPAFVLALAAGVSACQPKTSDTETKTTLPAAHESWCPPGFEGGAGDTCFALPEPAPKDTPVLLFLHGTYNGRGTTDEIDRVKAALQRGFAVVIPRGKRSLCSLTLEQKDQVCWPQDGDDTRAIKGVVADWDKALWQVEALLEAGTHKRYVLGTGSGGVLAVHVATRGLFQAQGFAVVQGGTGFPSSGAAKPAPLYLVSSNDDAAQTERTKALHEALGKAAWPHAFCPRAGSGMLGADDVEAALRFFKRDAEGALKPQGTSYPCDGGPAAGPTPSGKPAKKG